MSTDIREIEGPDGGASRMLKDLLAGAVGGVAQVLIGQVSFLGTKWVYRLRMRLIDAVTLE
jgi:hypothetical protein